MNKSILFISIYGGGYIQGGTQIYLNNLIGQLRKSGSGPKYYMACLNKINSPISSHQVTIKDSIMTRFMENWTFLKLQNKSIFISFFSFIWSILWLYLTCETLIKSNKIDLIYANGGQVSAIVAYLLNKKYKIKYLLHFHGIFNFSEFLNQNSLSLDRIILKNITKKYLLGAYKIIANSKDVADDLTKIESFKLKPIIMHCFIDENLFYPQNKSHCRKTLNLSSNDFIVISVNRLEKDKRVHFFLAVAKQITNPKIKFIFIGDGELKKEILNLAMFHKNIFYISPINNQMLPTYLNSANLIIGSTSQYYLSLTSIEALACGIPIIASNIPVSQGIASTIITNYRTLPTRIGYLINEDVESAIKLISDLAENPKRLIDKRTDCLNFYKEVYGLKNLIKIKNII